MSKLIIPPDGEKTKYVDGRPIPLHRIAGRAQMLELAKEGAISWEYGAFTESANADPACRGRTWESEYLRRGDKINYTRRSFQVYEEYCYAEGFDVGLNENSNVIEFGCAMGRNLIAAAQKYNSHVTGIDICQEVIDECQDFIYPNHPDKKTFYKANLRNADFLKQFDDNQFDLGICDHFLMCIAAGDEKKEVISEILRICKAVWFHEMRGKTEADYEEANSVQTGEDLTAYDDRLITVEELGVDSFAKREGNKLYVYNKPTPGAGKAASRFYVFKKVL